MMTRTFVSAVLCATALTAPAGAATMDINDILWGQAPLVIGHRGASGYLPEHTLAAYGLTIEMGTGIVEPDVASTADAELVVMHDASLARTPDVEERFAPRNGGHAVGDFTLAEIETLTVRPTSTAETRYPGFAPSISEPYSVLDYFNKLNRPGFTGG